MFLADNETEWDAPPEENWETMNKEERETTINGSLKILGNAKKHCTSPLILIDLLGDDASAALAQLKTKHLRKNRQDNLFINDVYRSVKYFDQKFQMRMERLLIGTVKSRNSTYEKREYGHRAIYKRIMDACSTERHTDATRLIGRADLPADAVNMITGALADVFGISCPRDFQHVGAYHCIANNDTLLAVSRKTSDGKSLLVQLASFLRRRY